MTDHGFPDVEESAGILRRVEELLHVFENSHEGHSGPLPEAARLLSHHYPRKMFKLQEVGGDGYLRVRSEFTTPLLASEAIGTEMEHGLSALLESEVGFADCPELREGVLSDEPVRHADRSTITRFIAAHFCDPALAEISDHILTLFEFSYLYLFPVRKAGLPLGVISLLSAEALSETDCYMWRVVSRMIGLSCSRRDVMRENAMKSRVVAELDTPVAVITVTEEVLVVSRRLQTILGETDALKVRRSVLRAHHRRQSAGERDAVVAITVGRDVAVPVRLYEKQIFDGAGVLLGYALWVVLDEPAGTIRPRELSDRELTVLRLIAGGCSTKEIAARLNRSVHTIQYHRSALRKKLRVHDSDLSFQQLASVVVSGFRE
ncbi:MAG: helix-turn-helix transcriptional regulator [Alkalispirochaeta sp.]